MSDRGDDRIDHFQPVADAVARWLICKSGFMKHAEEKIARAVSGEDTAGAVPAMRGGGQTDDQQASRGWPEIRNRLSPVIVGSKCRPLFGRYLPAVVAPGADRARRKRSGSEAGPIFSSDECSSRLRRNRLFFREVIEDGADVRDAVHRPDNRNLAGRNCCLDHMTTFIERDNSTPVREIA